jgi:hypothetical protein
MLTRDRTGLIRVRLASAVIAAAASGWGCSSVEPANDSGSSDARLYSLFQFAPANISDSSVSAAHGSYEEDPPIVLRGSTDPRWVRVSEAYFFGPTIKCS